MKERKNILDYIVSYIKNNKQILWVLYAPAYFAFFTYLENRDNVTFHLIHSKIDDKIPFIKEFIIPYYLWFAYIAIAVVLFYIYDIENFKKLAVYLATGMTMFLVVSYVYPNVLNLRPEVISGNGIIDKMVKGIYNNDTPTNVFPSIHVYNSIVVYVAIFKSDFRNKYKALNVLCFVLSVLIIMSTVFLKQHSIVDVAGAFVMAAVFYIPVYVINAEKVTKINSIKTLENSQE